MMNPANFLVFAGCIAGTLFWFTLAAAGLAALAATFGSLFTAVRYAGAAYLLYLAWIAPEGL